MSEPEYPEVSFVSYGPPYKKAPDLKERPDHKDWASYEPVPMPYDERDPMQDTDAELGRIKAQLYINNKLARKYPLCMCINKAELNEREWVWANWYWTYQMTALPDDVCRWGDFYQIVDALIANNPNKPCSQCGQ